VESDSEEIWHLKLRLDKSKFKTNCYCSRQQKRTNLFEVKFLFKVADKAEAEVKEEIDCFL
jgi:hypothetical protein